MSDVFDAYAAYYDLLYRDKDYGREVDYLHALIREHAPHARDLLELGCGTGAHAAFFARLDYTVHGIDVSTEMLARAREAGSALPAPLAARLSFETGDVRHWRGQRKYDVVLSLFHVFSYQIHDDDIRAAFDTAAAHVERGGLLMFDFWYGPAVLAIQPERRVRRLENENIRLSRHAEPEFFPLQNRVDVGYSIEIENRASGERSRFRETHRMRYFFQPELEDLLQNAGFELLRTQEWLSDVAPSETSWSAMIVARRLG